MSSGNIDQYFWEQVQADQGRTVELKRLSSWGHVFPLQPLVDDEVHNRAILLLKAVGELAVPSQVGRDAVKLANPATPYRQA